jgi:hypothetical protein
MKFVLHNRIDLLNLTFYDLYTSAMQKYVDVWTHEVDEHIQEGQALVMCTNVGVKGKCRKWRTWGG